MKSEDPEIRRPQVTSRAVDIERQRLRSRFTVARLIAQSRRKRGWSQEVLAEAAGTTQARISEIEGIHGNPRFDTIERVTRALGVQLTIVPRADFDGCEFLETAATKIGRLYDRFAIIFPSNEVVRRSSLSVPGKWEEMAIGITGKPGAKAAVG